VGFAIWSQVAEDNAASEDNAALEDNIVQNKA
jgi:hypothetical protein